MIGVYFIKNKINGIFYVGHSVDIKYRFRRHLYELKNNKHHCQYLQRAWNKYGADNFEFIIYKECSTEEESQDLEQYFIDNYKDNIYNVSNNAKLGGDLISDNPNRDEIINKMRKSLKKRYDNMTQEEKNLVYGSKGELNPMYGKKRPPEVIEKLRQASLGRPSKYKGKTYEEYLGKERAAIVKKNIVNNRRTYEGKENPFYGKCHTEKTKQILSQKNKGKKPTNMRKVKIKDVIYESVSAAARAENINASSMIYRINSKADKYKDFNYYEE